MARPRTTLTEIAQLAGVSVATVSKVLNDRMDVSPETRNRVQQILSETGYRPVNRNLRKPGTIEVFFADWHSTYVMSILEGISEATASAGYEVVIRTGHSHDEYSPDLDLSRLRASGRSGAILITVDTSQPKIKTAVEAGFPIVAIDPRGPGESNCVSIGATNYAGGVSATEHLLSLGHQRIAHAGGPADSEIGQARLAGFLSAIRASGIPLDESLITNSDFHYECGQAVAGVLLDRPDRPTAIFAASDDLAHGLMEEARIRSIRIPEQLSIVGFDDNFTASRTSPPLTTIAQPLVEMGRVAGQTLIQLANNAMVATRHIELSTRLVIRESTAPVPNS